MVAIISRRVPRYTQSLHRACTVARAPSYTERGPCPGMQKKRGGGGAYGTQTSVYQTWPISISPSVNFQFFVTVKPEPGGGDPGGKACLR